MLFIVSLLNFFIAGLATHYYITTHIWWHLSGAFINFGVGLYGLMTCVRYDKKVQ